MESPTTPRTVPTPTVAVDQFVKYLLDSGLLPAEEVKALNARIPAGQRADARPLVHELVKAGKLTTYQANQIYTGKSKGLVLGSYVVLDKLGQGGMGVVYKAEHRKMSRMVALKVLAPAITSQLEAVSRFQREVQAAARLSHPNIVAAYDADEAQGVHFLVMEFVDGSDLSSLVKKQGPLPVGQAVDCVLQAAHGLLHAHRVGLVHRDIKPANLLRDAKGKVKILDMGLARFEGAGNTVGPNELTQSGSILGTCEYMAPEQALNTRKADLRADIYSLGCTLYYLLSGTTMYGGETSMEKLMAHQQEPIPPLPGAAKELQAVYQGMVAKKAEDRYQSMAEVIAALEAAKVAQQRRSAAETGKHQATAALAADTMVGGSGTREIRQRLAHLPRKRSLVICAGLGAVLVCSALLLLPREEPGGKVWVDDATPAGAKLESTGGDTWRWVNANPTPFSGTVAHQSTHAPGVHQHFFLDSPETLSVGVGDTLYAYVYLDPAHPPTEIMLQWHDTKGSWDHRAYWGANNIHFGIDGTNSSRPMGPLPKTGRWVRLEVPAGFVGLEGMAIDGMGFTVFDGRATWDKAGIVQAALGR